MLDNKESLFHGSSEIQPGQSWELLKFQGLGLILCDSRFHPLALGSSF